MTAPMKYAHWQLYRSFLRFLAKKKVMSASRVKCIPFVLHKIRAMLLPEQKYGQRTHIPHLHSLCITGRSQRWQQQKESKLVWSLLIGLLQKHFTRFSTFLWLLKKAGGILHACEEHCNATEKSIKNNDFKFRLEKKKLQFLVLIFIFLKI